MTEIQTILIGTQTTQITKTVQTTQIMTIITQTEIAIIIQIIGTTKKLKNFQKGPRFEGLFCTLIYNFEYYIIKCR